MIIFVVLPVIMIIIIIIKFNWNSLNINFTCQEYFCLNCKLKFIACLFCKGDLWKASFRVHGIAYGSGGPSEKMSVLVNFLLQNTNLVLVLNKIC